jgi:hypothetical protein
VLASATVVTGAGRSGAATSTLLEPGVPRVLVISTPGVGWSAIDPEDTPNLWRLFEGAAVGNLTARTIGRADLASGYLTMGAGTRATASRSPLDGAGMEPTERFGDVLARDAFLLTTGRAVDGGVLQLGLEPILAANAEERVDVTIGTLAEVLTDAGWARAVIGNGDGSYPDQSDVMRRYAVNALMTDSGVVPAGRAGTALLQEDPDAPFGVRYDNDAVVAAFREVWHRDSVVLVEASDLVRADAFGLIATPERAAASLRRAMRHTDALVGQLLDEVDLARDAVVVVSPTRTRGAVLSAVAVHAPGVPPGLVTSASTRRAGFVLLSDVAPTVLGLAGLPRDRDMAGSRFTVGRAQPLTARIDTLQDATDASLFRDRVRGPVTLVYTVLLAVLLGLTAWTIARERLGRRWRALLSTGALALLCYVPMVYVARLVPLHDIGTPAYWSFLVGGSLLAAATIRIVTRGRAPDAVLVALGLVVAVLVLDVVTGANLQLSSAFGYSASVGIRVAGFGNVAYAMLGAAALLVSGLLAHRIGGRRGAWLGCAVLAVALVADVAPFWGSDVGGVLSLVPAFGVAAVLLLGIRFHLTWKVALIAAAVTLVVLGAVTAFDLSRPADARTHLGRLAQQVADRGLSPFANTIARKVDANLNTWSSSEWRLLLVVAVVFLALLALRHRDALHRVVDAIPELRASLAGLAVLAVLGYAFNDSGVMVPAAALSVASAALVVLLLGDAMRARPQRGAATEASTASVVAAAVSQE